MIRTLAAVVLLCASSPAQLRPGSAAGGAEEPVRYVGKAAADTRFHDGALRPVVGVKNYQVLRANRAHPDLSDGKGWTYAHEPMLGHAHGRIYLHWFLSPKNEHEAPSHTVITSSVDGVNWDRPRVLFPVYELADGRYALMHQRSGFYLAPNGRLLALGFYGAAPGHIGGPGAIGRVVREIRADNSFGPIFFIRYNRQNGWDESNTWYRLYRSSKDTGFVEACEALLNDKLHTLSWWEEDQSKDGFYTVTGGIAPSFYHRPDGKVVALWKRARAALSTDEGRTWSPIVELPTIVTAAGKNWGQKLGDGRYAMVYNPSRDDSHRWPLGIVTSEDGIHFDNLLAVHGEVPPQRYGGRHKDFGPQYVRGVAEGTGTPPGPEMWVAYSVNKEDIWVSRVPVPVTSAVKGDVRDTFTSEADLDNWNLYCPQWAPVRFEKAPAAAQGALAILDRDPYDYAKAVRVFEEGAAKRISLSVRPAQNSHGRLELEITDARGQVAVRVAWAEDGRIHASDGPSQDVALRPYRAGERYRIEITMDARIGRYSLTLGNDTLVASGLLAAPVRTLERLVLRTGATRTQPTLETRNYWHRRQLSNAGPETPLFWWGEDLRAPGEPEREAVFHVDDVTVRGFQIGKE